MHIALLVTAFLLFAVLMLAWRWRDAKVAEDRRGWRVRCIVAGRWAYEERSADGWVAITLEEFGDYRESPHIIRIPASPARATARRDEIIGRLKSELAPPHYILQNASPQI